MHADATWQLKKFVTLDVGEVRGWTESVLEKNPAYANAFETLTPFKVI